MRVHGTTTEAQQHLVERVKEVGGQLCVRPSGLAPKTRRYVVVTGFSPEHNLGVFNSDVGAVTRALTERYFFCANGKGGFRPAYRVNRNAFNIPHLAAFRDAVCHHMPRLPRLTPAQVVAMYSGAKRRTYERAAVSLERRPLCLEDARLTSFVKFEKQDISKAPRIINPRSPRYNLELARFLKHAEHHYFRSVNRVFGGRTPATVIKGLNADQSGSVLRAKWEHFRRPCAIGLDATKFDMHVSITALRYEHGFYTRLHNNHPVLGKLLKWQEVNEGAAYLVDGRVRFATQGTRCSGDINTSLGNCLLMCALVHAYAVERGCDIELANNGDDCVAFLESADERRFREGLGEWFRKRGFAIVAEPTVHEFEQVEFCQTRPVCIGGRWRMVRTVQTILRKDPMCLVPVPSDATLKKWLGAVGECGGALCSGVPVLEAFYEMYRRWGTPASRGFIEEVYRNRSQLQLSRGVEQAVIDDRARVSFYYAFGITPDRQVQMEAAFRSAERTELTHEVVTRGGLTVCPGVNVITYE